MTTPISAREFHESEGVEDWRAIFWGACAVFRTPDYETAARFVESIAEIAADIGHYPDIDLRPGTVAIRTFSPTDATELSRLDVAIAQRISAAARDLGLEADPGSVKHVQFTIDVVDGDPVKAFWEAALDYERLGEADMVDPRRSSPPIWFQQVSHHKLPHNRIHLDISLPHDVAEARVQAVLDAGGRMLGDRHAPAWWSLIDAEGNVVDIATWQGRE